MKKLCKKIYSFLWGIKSWLWCLFHGVKYHRGVLIGHHVRKYHKAKLVLSRNVKIAKHCYFWGDGVITIGENTSIGPESDIYASKDGGVTFGKNINCAKRLFVIDANHNFARNASFMELDMIAKPIVLKDEIWIGYNVTILPGVTLESGVVCGACAVITKSFKENSIVAGNPARVINVRK